MRTTTTKTKAPGAGTPEAKTTKTGRAYHNALHPFNGFPGCRDRIDAALRKIRLMPELAPDYLPRIEDVRRFVTVNRGLL